MNPLLSKPYSGLSPPSTKSVPISELAMETTRSAVGESGRCSGSEVSSEFTGAVCTGSGSVCSGSVAEVEELVSSTVAEFGGIYEGDGKMIACLMPGTKVKEVDITTGYYTKHFYRGVAIN